MVSTEISILSKIYFFYFKNVTYNFLNLHKKLYEKINFTEISKILARYKKYILLDCQINYVRCSSIMSSAAKSFDILATNLSILHNYFNALTKLFSDW